jgi:hypothetical protein
LVLKLSLKIPCFLALIIFFQCWERMQVLPMLGKGSTIEPHLHPATLFIMRTQIWMFFHLYPWTISIV